MRVLDASIQPACIVLCLAAVLGVTGSSALAGDGADQPATGHTFAVDRWTDREQKIVDALNRPLTKPLKFVDTDLKTILDTLADAHDIPIRPDARSLDDAQINLREERLSIELADVTLRSALNLILEPFELAYVIENEVMRIMWEEDAENRLTTVVYDVRPLIEAGYREVDLLTVIMSETSGPWFPDDPNKRIDNLIGGVTVRQTQRVHDEIEELLHDMLRLAQRASKGATPSEPERPARRDRKRHKNRDAKTDMRPSDGNEAPAGSGNAPKEAPAM